MKRHFAALRRLEHLADSQLMRAESLPAVNEADKFIAAQHEPQRGKPQSAPLAPNLP